MSSAAPTPPDPPPLADKTASILLALFQDFYRQEIGAEEDVHRTLPFFATALGLIIAAVNYAAGQLPAWDTVTAACPRGRGRLLDHHMLACDWPVLVAAFLLALAALLGIGVLGFLAAATKRRNYLRAGPEAIHLERAKQLQGFYRQLGLGNAALDNAVALDLQQQLLEDLARVTRANREMTLQRYRFRARAVSCLLWSLLCALLATIFAALTVKAGLLAR